jgi:transcriptional regulator with XRE-family HTH domain
MPRAEKQASELAGLEKRLTAARLKKGLTQAELAARCQLQRQQITFFERGARIPALDQLVRIARALELPLQRFLSGADRPGNGVRETAIELRNLGLIDLWVEKPIVPGAFRRPEEVVALAVAGDEPEARIVEGIPAILAWNRWNKILLRAFARVTGPRTIYRLAWLADVVLALARMGGFPGGCPGKEDLTGFVKGVKEPPSDRGDDLGRPAATTPTSPVWKRWRINYAADLATFRQRAEGLVALRQAERPERRGKSAKEG